MSFPFYIARRYLFSKKQHNVINLISGISVVGVALATLAMVCVMSGFNGFQDLIGSAVGIGSNAGQGNGGRRSFARGSEAQ